MNDLFDFKEALAYIECGFKVVNETGRIYYMEDDIIICKPVKGLPYKVNKFYIDAIQSRKWRLLDE